MQLFVTGQDMVCFNRLAMDAWSCMVVNFVVAASASSLIARNEVKPKFTALHQSLVDGSLYNGGEYVDEHAIELPGTRYRCHRLLVACRHFASACLTLEGVRHIMGEMVRNSSSRDMDAVAEIRMVCFWDPLIVLFRAVRDMQRYMLGDQFGPSLSVRPNGHNNVELLERCMVMMCCGEQAPAADPTAADPAWRRPWLRTLVYDHAYKAAGLNDQNNQKLIPLPIKTAQNRVAMQVGGHLMLSVRGVDWAAWRLPHPNPR